ncbi:MAG: hypothetical protein ACRD29_07645 [Acidimicrobiales bacterium]
MTYRVTPQQVRAAGQAIQDAGRTLMADADSYPVRDLGADALGGRGDVASALTSFLTDWSVAAGELGRIVDRLGDLGVAAGELYAATEAAVGEAVSGGGRLLLPN